METVYTIDSLNQMIEQLEIRQDAEWCAIKDEIDEIKDNLKPLKPHQKHGRGNQRNCGL